MQHIFASLATFIRERPAIYLTFTAIVLFALSYHRLGANADLQLFPIIHCDQTSPYATWQLCRKMAAGTPKPVQAHKLRIMAVGDSVTAGPLGSNAYREDLINLLAGNDIEMTGNMYWGTMKPDQHNRLEAGMGRDISNVTDAINEALPKWQPNLILLHAGTNNMIGNKGLDTLPGEFASMLDQMIGHVPDACIVVAQLIPCAFRIDQVEAFNKEIRRIVGERAKAGKKLVPVDMYTDWPADGLGDIAHPNAKGYQEMAKRWHEAIMLANGLGYLGS